MSVISTLSATEAYENLKKLTPQIKTKYANDIISLSSGTDADKVIRILNSLSSYSLQIAPNLNVAGLDDIGQAQSGNGAYLTNAEFIQLKVLLDTAETTIKTAFPLFGEYVLAHVWGGENNTKLIPRTFSAANAAPLIADLQVIVNFIV